MDIIIPGLTFEDTLAGAVERQKEFEENLELMAEADVTAMARVMSYLLTRPDQETHEHTKAEMDAIFKAAEQLH